MNLQHTNCYILFKLLFLIYPNYKYGTLLLALSGNFIVPLIYNLHQYHPNLVKIFVQIFLLNTSKAILYLGNIYKLLT